MALRWLAGELLTALLLALIPALGFIVGMTVWSAP
jgi:hypothetical protein